MSSPKAVPPIETFAALIRGQALKCWRKLPAPKPHDVDDLESEGAVVYYQAIPKHDPKRAKFITFFQLRLMQRYSTILARAYRRVGRVEVRDPESMESVPDRPVAVPTRLDDLPYRRLSREAWLVAREILEPSPEMRERLAERPRAIKTHLREHFGFGRMRLTRILCEIANAVNSKVA